MVDIFIKGILLFFIYSFLGWIVEVCFVYIGTKKLENRGFLHMPLVPIYGFGALFIIITLSNFLDSIFMVYILGVLVTSILEYVTSYGMEKMFNMHWWDYSTYRFNINGRVCLRNSILFGVLSLFVMYILNPPLVELVDSLSLYAETYLVNFLLVLITFDVYFTLKKLKALPTRDIRLLSGRVKIIDGKYVDTKGKKITIGHGLLAIEFIEAIKKKPVIFSIIGSIILSQVIFLITKNNAIALAFLNALFLVIIVYNVNNKKKVKTN